MSNWNPTPEEIDRCGDALLEALVAIAPSSNPPGVRMQPQVGDLVVEVSSFGLDWERLGYLIEPLPTYTEQPITIWSIGRRIVRWHNGSVIRIGPAGMRLRSLPYPSAEDLENDRNR